MSKIHGMAAGAAMAVSAVTLLDDSRARIGRSASYRCQLRSAAPRCQLLPVFEGGNDCSFTSYAQCQATASGTRSECYRNDFGKEGETLHW